MVENNRLISNNQFGFRQRHSTIEQTHRIVQSLNEALENKQYCSAAFYISLNHSTKYSILYLRTSLRRSLPLNYFSIQTSYLHSRHFLVKVETEYTELSSFNAGVPQDSVLGSVIIPAIHCKPANLPRIYYSNLCRRYCNSNIEQWSSYCFAETTKWPTCNSKLV
jgi:hypothetical protein